MSALDAALEWAANFKKRWAYGRDVLARFPAWATPNRITVFRTLLILPIIWCIREEYDGWAVILFGISSTLDFVDGALAHYRNLHTPLGAFLDPLSDKLVNCGVLLAAVPRLPSAFALPITVMCVFALLLTFVRLGRMWRAYRKTGDVTRAPTAAKDVGKLKTVFEITAIILLQLGMHLDLPALVWTAGVLLVLAVLLAARSFWVQYQATH